MKPTIRDDVADVDALIGFGGRMKRGFNHHLHEFFGFTRDFKLIIIQTLSEEGRHFTVPESVAIEAMDPIWTE